LPTPSHLIYISIFLFLILPQHIPLLLPYTTLFRSTALSTTFSALSSILSACSAVNHPFSMPFSRNSGIGSRSLYLSPSDLYFCSDRKSTRVNSSHVSTSYAVFCLTIKTTYTSTT